jgi:hypothetical protein
VDVGEVSIISEVHAPFNFRVDREDGGRIYLRIVGNIAHLHTGATTHQGDHHKQLRVPSFIQRPNFNQAGYIAPIGKIMANDESCEMWKMSQPIFK